MEEAKSGEMALHQLRLKRSSRNPLLEPTDNWWESKLVYNPGVLRTGEDIHLVYTAKGEDDIARLGYVRLRNIDQVEERFPHPIFLPQEWFEPHGVEDPRLIELSEEGRVVMLYAGKERDMARVCESSISRADFGRKRWSWSRHRLILPIMVGVHNRNAALFPRRIGGRLALLHRPMTMAENIWLSFSYDGIHWYDHKEILKARPGFWDDAKVGIAGPPIELEEGWLIIYHGVEAKTWTYRLGFAILHRENPEVVIFRSETPILEPEEEYEFTRDGLGIVFSCGATIVEKNLVLYYGAADRVIGVALGEVPGTPI